MDLRRLSGGPYTVIAFPGMRGESSSIVDSPSMAKALEKVASSDQVVVIAHDFTAEVRAKLEQLGTIFFFDATVGGLTCAGDKSGMTPNNGLERQRCTGGRSVLAKDSVLAGYEVRT